MGIAMELVPSALAVDPGRLGSIHVHLTNTGPDPCDVAVQVAEDQRDWSWVHPELCGVAPGAEEVVDVFFRPAKGAHPPAGEHKVEITARVGAEDSATGQGTVDVGTWVDAAGVLDPVVARDVAGHTYTLNFENRGNVAIRAALATDDPSGDLVMAVRPAEVSAEPGETVTATVDVQARKKLKRGEQRYRVCVLAKVDGISDLRIEGAFYQRGIKPPK